MVTEAVSSPGSVSPLSCSNASAAAAAAAVSAPRLSVLEVSELLVFTYCEALLVLSALLGLVANGLVVASHCVARQCQAPRHRLLASTATLDLLHNLLVKPGCLLLLVWPRARSLRGLMYLHTGLYWVCTAGSLSHMVMLACNHLVLVTRGLQDMARLCNRAVTQLLACLSCLLPALLYTIPISSLPLTHYHPYMLGLPQAPATAAFYVRLAAVWCLVLSFTFVAVYARILRHLHACHTSCLHLNLCHSGGGGGGGHSRLDYYQRTRNTIVKMCAAHLLMVLPAAAFNLVDPTFSVAQLRLPHTLAHHLQLSHSSVMVFLLTLRLPEFQRSITALCRCQPLVHSHPLDRRRVHMMRTRSSASVPGSLTHPCHGYLDTSEAHLRNPKCNIPEETLSKK